MAKLVNITPITMVYYHTYNELVNGVYKPTNITGGHNGDRGLMISVEPGMMTNILYFG
jgi:hypothetical protein